MSDGRVTHPGRPVAIHGARRIAPVVALMVALSALGVFFTASLVVSPFLGRASWAGSSTYAFLVLFDVAMGLGVWRLFLMLRR